MHSPFAFHFITDVIYENAPYYRYKELDKALKPWQRFRRRKGLHLLFRLANWRQPCSIVARTDHPQNVAYLRAGCAKAKVYDSYSQDGASVDLICLDRPDEEALHHLHAGSVLVLDRMDRYKSWFYGLPSVVSFDLGDLGIAFFDPQYYKQNYIVNF